MVNMKNTFFQVIKTGVYTLSACSILALTSCQGSSDEPEVVQAHANQFASVPIQAEVALDESARALVYTLGEGGSFQHNLRENKQRMWTIIRSSDASKPSYSADLEWEVRAGNKLVLNTKLNLPADVHTAIQQGDWYASCILSGQASASGQTFVFDQANQRLVANTPNGANSLDHSESITPGTETTRMPSLYILPWTKVSSTNTTGKIAISFSGARMKPMGAVLRLNIQTEPAVTNTTFESPIFASFIESTASNIENDTWQPEKITLYGTYNGYYDFADANINQGIIPPFVYTETAREYVCTIPTLQTPLKFNSPSQDYGYFYFWSPEEYIEVSAKLKYQYDSPKLMPGDIWEPTYRRSEPRFSQFRYFNFSDTSQARAGRIMKLQPNTNNSQYKYVGHIATNAVYRVIYSNNQYLMYMGNWWNAGDIQVNDSFQSTIELQSGHTKRVILKYRPEIRANYTPILSTGHSE